MLTFPLFFLLLKNPVDEEASEAELAALIAKTAPPPADDDSDDSLFGKDDSSDSSSDSDSDSDASLPTDRRARLLKKFGRRPEKPKKEEVEKPKKARAKKIAPVVSETTTEESPEGASDGFTAVGKSGKVIEFNAENLFKRLGEMLEARGKKVGFNLFLTKFST